MRATQYEEAFLSGLTGSGIPPNKRLRIAEGVISFSLEAIPTTLIDIHPNVINQLSKEQKRGLSKLIDNRSGFWGDLNKLLRT